MWVPLQALCGPGLGLGHRLLSFLARDLGGMWNISTPRLHGSSTLCPDLKMQSFRRSFFLRSSRH